MLQLQGREKHERREPKLNHAEQPTKELDEMRGNIKSESLQK